MDLMSLLNVIFFTLVDAIIFTMALCVLSGNARYPADNKGKYLIFVLFYALISYWASYFIPMGIHTIVITVFVVLSFCFFTKANLYQTFFTWIILLIFGFVIEFTMVGVTGVLSGYPLSNALNVLTNPVAVLVCSFATKIVEAALVAFIYVRKLDLYLKINLFKKQSKLPHLIIIQTFLLGLIIFSVNAAILQPQQIVAYNVMLISTYLLFVALAVIDFMERKRLSALQNQYIFQQEHIKNLEAITTIIRKEKHDFNNHLNTIYGLCTLNKSDMGEKIKEYIKQATGKAYFAYRSINSGNDYIDALLAVKSNYASDRNIKLDVDIQAPLSQAAMDDKELVSVFSNIIDNSFDALLNGGQYGSMWVAVRTYKAGQSYYISIRNNGPVIPERYVKKIFSNGFSTKNNSSGDHGFGLYIVKQGVERYGGAIDVASNEQETEFLVQLEGKKEDHEESSIKIDGYDLSGELQPHGTASH